MDKPIVLANMHQEGDALSYDLRSGPDQVDAVTCSIDEHAVICNAMHCLRV